MAFSGAWLTQAQVDPQVPLVPGLDPQHLNPDPDPNVPPGFRPDWVSTAPAPDLPEALWPGAPVQMPTGVGPVDVINYTDTLAGVGFGHGLTELQAQDIAAGANLSDDGSYAATHYRAAVDRDGTYHAGIVPDELLQQDSPATTLLQRTGVGVPTDPHARTASRLQRWFDGVIDMHWWNVSFRPLRPRYARTAVVHDVPNSSQNAPDTPSVLGYRPAPADRFVTPMTRRSPGDWQTPFTGDGTGATLAGAAYNYGLPPAGL